MQPQITATNNSLNTIKTETNTLASKTNNKQTKQQHQTKINPKLIQGEKPIKTEQQTAAIMKNQNKSKA